MWDDSPRLASIHRREIRDALSQMLRVLLKCEICCYRLRGMSIGRSQRSCRRARLKGVFNFFVASLSRNDVKNWSNAFAQNWRKVKGKTLDEPFALGPSGESTPNRLPPITTKRRRGGKSFLARQAQRQTQA